MAEEPTKSRFIRHQDKDRDGLIDVCVVDVVPAEVPCLDCSPNPNALVENWKNKTIDEPFLNEKTCVYHITVVTEHSTTLSTPHLEAYADDNFNTDQQDEAMTERFDEYVEEAIKSLLDAHSKDDSDTSIELIKEVIDYTEYYLDPRPFSRLKLLYSVPYDDLHALEDAEEESEEEEEDTSEAVTVKYKMTELKPLLIRVRKSLNLYNRYLKVYRGLEGGNVYFDGIAGTSLAGTSTKAIFPLELYGDLGLVPNKSIMGKVLTQLDGFLVQKGYNIPGVGGLGGFLNDKVVEAEFKFSKEFELKQMKIWTENCGEKAIIFNKKLKPLLKKSAWKDPTAMAYFAKLEDMDNDLQAREPKPWLEFIKEYTYPSVYGTTNPLDANTDPEKTVGSCIAGALAEEGKQLGQDILDEVFGLGDAIASAFHKNLCRQSLEDSLADVREAMGDWESEILDSMDGLVKVTDIEPEQQGAGALAKEQAVTTAAPWKKAKKVQEGEDVESDPSICEIVFDKGLAQPPGDLLGSMDMLWEMGFDPLKMCGLLELLMDATGCLMAGLALDDALKSMLNSALQAMGIENFGSLFANLPPEKQAELDALVQKKIETGEIYGTETEGIETTAVYETGEGWSKPWGKKDTEEEKKETGDGDRTAASGGETAVEDSSLITDRYDSPSASNQNQVNPGLVMQAYISALLEIYKDDLLELLDFLNKFPGAPIIAKLIASFDCPKPALFNPSIMDWIKDIEIPWCSGNWDITLPELINPSGWLPKIKDLLAELFKQMIKLLTILVIKILWMILAKICQLLGDALCKALEMVGELAASLPDVAMGKTTFANVIKESICGEEASSEEIDNTIIDMFASLGAGGAALADNEQVLSMSEDIASATTQTELMNAFLGDPSREFLDIMDTIITYEYPDMQEAFPNKEKMGNFFKNAGNLMPVSFRNQMKDLVEQIPIDDATPANPSLCATPEQLEQFKNLRCELLSGRATQEQCDEMFENLQNSMIDDLDDLGSILQKGIPNYIADNLPPLVSDPGCDNGMLPFESEEQKAAVSAVLGGDLDQLQTAFSYDMLGAGPGEKRWGLINMILSDTMGNPYTTHQRKVFFRRRWVDFYMNEPFDEDESIFNRLPDIENQKGAYPSEVAGHLLDQLEALDTTFASNNEVQEAKTFSKSFEDLNISRFGKNVDLLSLPDFGYNFTTTVDYENEKVKFIKQARKADADVTFSFVDNAKGAYEDYEYSFGLDINFYLSDLMESGSTYVNRPQDNARISIINNYNVGANLDFSAMEFMTREEKQAAKDEEKDATTGIIYDRKFEFLSIDDTLDGIDTSEYTDFLSAFETKTNYTPQVILLKEILNKNGASVDESDMKDFHDEFMSSVLSTLVTEVVENEAAFTYGAVFDGLTKEDVEYYTEGGTPYFEATNDDGDDISNDDMILGISRMQYEQGEDANRVFYLDPAQYGGSYMNPPLYISPLKNEGWLGFVEVMFPEVSACKPRKTDLIDFEDIQKKIDDTYPTIPEDERLKSDPDCIRERPYERILERPSVAAIEGLITAAIRIFVSTHMLKAMATFTKFYPKFTETYSSLFAQYIVEDMERHFKSAQKSFWEFFNPFKDSEFWYAFLEQSVQTYNRREAAGEVDPPQNVYDALEYLSAKVKEFDYPYRSDLREAKDLDEISRLKTLKNYRSKLNLEAVQDTEEYAKLVLKELVNEQLNYMGVKFVENLETLGMSPSIFNLDYYVLENLTQGSELTLAEEIKEEPKSLPTEGEELYTGGTEFSNTETGEMYTGYYHVTTDNEGNTVYMAGEFHIEGEHALLRPLADQLIVPIGDVQDYGTGGTSSTTQPFLIEKYISINGKKYAPDDALDIVKSNSLALLISEVYPGTLDHVVDAGGKVVGLTGELGLRYGLEFSVVTNGTAYPVTAVEVDALDVSIAETPPLEGDSKLLLCLVNMLTNNDTYKLVAQYIFPMKKITALIAIYNSEGLLPSIGELTVEPEMAYGGDSGWGVKPGMQVEVSTDGVAASAESQPGWAAGADRSPGLPTVFATMYDEWDQVLLRSSKSRLKKLFKTHYNSREFDIGDDDNEKPGKLVLKNLLESFRPAAGRQLLPWWKRRMLRTNPFNSAGELCEKED